MQDFWSFPCCLSCTLGSLLKCSWSLLYRYYFGRCFSELTKLVPLPYFRKRSTCYSDRLHIFSFTIPRCCNILCTSHPHPLSARGGGVEHTTKFSKRGVGVGKNSTFRGALLGQRGWLFSGGGGCNFHIKNN